MDLTTIAVIAIIGGAIALAVLGLALRAMRQERITQAAGAAAETARPNAEPAPAASTLVEAMPEAPPAEALPPAASLDPAPAPQAEAPPAEAVEVLRVLRDASAGALLVEIDGQRYADVNDIKDQRHGLGLVDVVMDLQRFLGLDIVAGLAAAEQNAPAAAPGSALPPIEKPSLNPIKQMMILRDRELRKAREKRDAPQPGSIVEEIEAILVKRLIDSPFEGRSIHMRPGLHSGAHIDVDGRGYESIEDVEDLEVKEFLKTVIADWEAGQR